MKHAYFVSDDLNELEHVHDELIEEGFKDRHIHVMSEEEAEVEKHHLRNVNALEKTDMFSFMLKGAEYGVVLVVLIFAAAYLFDYGSSVVMTPIAIAAAVLFGFCVWEAGLMGLHRINHRFASVQPALRQGDHILILDYRKRESRWVEGLAKAHPRLSQISL